MVTTPTISTQRQGLLCSPNFPIPAAEKYSFSARVGAYGTLKGNTDSKV